MTPFHPKLRKALLADRQHRRRGLTEALLIQYEGLLNQAFHDRYYPEPEHEDCYRISADTMLNLLAEKPSMPEALITKLHGQTGKVFQGKDAFLAMLKSLLAEDFEEYKDALLKYADMTHCCLADAAFIKLKQKNIPEEVLKKLHLLKYRRVRGKAIFLALLEQNLGQPATDRYGAVILSEALTQNTLEDIKIFRDTYMPNFDNIHTQWVKDQQAALSAHYFDVRVRNWLRSSLYILKNIFILPFLKLRGKQPTNDLKGKKPRV